MYSLNSIPISSSSSFFKITTKNSPIIQSISPNPKPIMSNSQSNDHHHSNNLTLDRRNLLIGAGTLFATSSSSSPSPAAAADYPIKLDGAVKRVVIRPRKSRTKAEKEDEEEVLVIEGIEFDRSLPVKFDVYVNDVDDVMGGPDTAEFAGSFANVPHGQRRGSSKTMKTGLNLGISDLLEEVGADDDDSVVVTLVPKFGKGQITVQGIGIKLQG
ncbi:polyphenol oxidase, chloroplastic [Cannabis sativa]|uniref:polyphenol oxidase, chloroplastic n=1 Tax=Cannabis sativa TaxID=3483 RepID=UPI0029CA1596|nr:polyphenol oxidase, chloroplastic [Cannabis sativa]